MKRLLSIILLVIVILLALSVPVIAETDNNWIVYKTCPVYDSDINQINKNFYSQSGTESTQNKTIDYWSKWNSVDTTLILLQIADWGQTRCIATATGCWSTSQDGSMWYWPTEYKYYEINPLLGKHPSLSAVNAYFAVLVGTDIFIIYKANKDPEHWSKTHKWWSIIETTLETYCVTRNLQVGVEFDF